MTLLPRAGLALALLHLFFCPENLPSGLSLSGVDQSIVRRDGTFSSGNGCAGLCGPRSHWEEEELGRATSI